MLAGTHKQPKYYPVHNIAERLHPDIKDNLLSFHAPTGCDTTYSFSRFGKKHVGSYFNYVQNQQYLVLEETDQQGTLKGLFANYTKLQKLLQLLMTDIRYFLKVKRQSKPYQQQRMLQSCTLSQGKFEGKRSGCKQIHVRHI